MDTPSALANRAAAAILLDVAAGHARRGAAEEDGACVVLEDGRVVPLLGDILALYLERALRMAGAVGVHASRGTICVFDVVGLLTGHAPISRESPSTLLALAHRLQAMHRPPPAAHHDGQAQGAVLACRSLLCRPREEADEPGATLHDGDRLSTLAANRTMSPLPPLSSASHLPSSLGHPLSSQPSSQLSLQQQAHQMAHHAAQHAAHHTPHHAAHHAAHQAARLGGALPQRITRPLHITEAMPPFPPAYTFRSTESVGVRDTDKVLIVKAKAEQQRQVERNLFRLLETTNSLPPVINYDESFSV